MDKLRAITVFRRVIELGSFKGAAEDLNLSKAAISKNIRELEEFLQSPLINRTTRNLSITDSGQAYYQQVRHILDDLRNADLAIQESTDSLSGVLRISAPMSFGLTLINAGLCEFMKTYPKVKVELVLSDQYTDLVSGGFDIAIRGAGTLKDSSLKQRKLLTLKRILCASPAYLSNHPDIKKPQELEQHNCMVYSLSSSPTQWTYKKNTKKHTILIRPSSYVVNNSLALTQAAITGLGIILTPELLVRTSLNSRQLVPLLPDIEFESHALYAVYPYHKETSRKLRTLIEFLAEYLSRETELPTKPVVGQ